MSPRRPRTDRSAIVEAALALLDEDGLDAFSMRRLGQRLGVDPMTVYRYIPSQSHLFDAVVERVWSETVAGMGGIERPLGHGAPEWALEVDRMCRSLRATLLRRPAAAALVATRPVVTPVQLELADRVLGSLAAGGLEADEAMRLLDNAVAYVAGKVLGELREPAAQRGPDPAETAAGLDPAAYPHLARAIADGYAWDPERQFDEGLTALLIGWAASRSA